MSKVDKILRPKNLPYYGVATRAYAVALQGCFGANKFFQNGQPILLCLDPALVGSSVACTASNGQGSNIWEGGGVE